MIVSYFVDPDNASLVNIIVDGDHFCEVHVKVFGSNPRLPKNVETTEELVETIRKLEEKKAKNLILNKLSQKNTPSFELRNLLESYLISHEITNALIHEFQDAGYINDDEWLEGVVRGLTSQKKGPGAIERKLREKRAPEVLIEQALALVAENDDQADQIRTLLETRYRARNLMDFREREKTVAALIRRGFDINTIRTVINNL